MSDYVRKKAAEIKADQASRQVLLSLRDAVEDALSVGDNETDLLGAILYLIAHEAPETFFEYVADIEADRDDTRKVWLEEAMPEGRA